MSTNADHTLTADERLYLAELKTSIEDGFELWRAETHWYYRHAAAGAHCLYRNLLPPELKNALIQIQRIKPEILRGFGFEVDETVKKWVKTILETRHEFLEMLIEESRDFDPYGYDLLPFINWFKEETFWRVYVVVRSGRCSNPHCLCDCPSVEIEYAVPMLTPVSESFAFEEDMFKDNPFGKLFR